jgi:hypothetical protein
MGRVKWVLKIQDERDRDGLMWLRIEVGGEIL